MSSTTVVRAQEEGTPLRLVRVSGPACETIEVLPRPKTVVGRLPDCDVQLADLAVSKRHAQFEYADGTDLWSVSDAGSRNGTFLNGRPISGDERRPLHDGDLVAIGPWVFRTSLPGARPSTLFTLDDEDEVAGRIDRVGVDQATRRRLEALIEAAADMSSADSPEQVYARALWALEQGSDFDRFAVVRTVGGAGRIEVLAESWTGEGEAPAFSRTLVAAAAEGDIASLDGEPQLQHAHSIVGGDVKRALCVPVSIGDTITCFVYVDAMHLARERTEDATAYAAAIGRLVGLSLANMQRMTHERELNAARDVQRRIMPPERGEAGFIRWAMRAIPGRELAGDFFGVATTPARSAVFLGDVSGKGASAALLMATIQAYMMSRLADIEADAGMVMASLDEHVRAVSASGEFATLCLLSVRDDGSVRLVDAGHGYAARIAADGTVTPIESPDGGLPVGVAAMPDGYRPALLEAESSDRIVLFTDGVAEQVSPRGEQFGVERVCAALQGSASIGEDVERLAAALERHAGRPTFDDDVTIASISLDGARDDATAWGGPPPGGPTSPSPRPTDPGVPPPPR